MKSLSLAGRLSGLTMLALIGLGTMNATAVQEQPRSTTEPLKKSTVNVNKGDARTPMTTECANSVAEILKSKNYSLADAVKTAEDHCKGKAVYAISRLKDGVSRASSTNDAYIDVIVLDSNNALNVVSVGLDGKVTGMNPWSSNTMAMGAMPGSRAIVKADKIIGHNIVNSQGEKIGEIKDLAIDPVEGRVAYGVLAFDMNFLGRADTFYAVPWSLIHQRDNDTCTLDVSKDTIVKAPSFTASNWPDMRDLKWNETIHTYYGQPYYWDQVRRDRDTDVPPSASDTMGRRPTAYKVSEVIGMNVINNQSESLGEIQDVAVEPGTGDIRYLVLSVGGFLGINERYIAVPWSAFHHDEKANKLVLNVNKETVKNAPGFDKKNWPNYADQSWGAEIHKYYQREPFWSDSSTNTNPRNDPNRPNPNDPNRPR